MTINDICFQIIDWTQDHELETDIEEGDGNLSDGSDNNDEHDNNDDSDKSNKETTELLCIRLFGKTDDNKSICLNTNFTPYFYVKIPSIWNNTKAQILVSHIKSNISNKNALLGLVSFDVVNKKDFSFGFDFYLCKYVLNK